MTGSERGFLYVLGLCSAFNVVLNLLLIPPFGIVGAAIANSSALILTNLLCVEIVRRRFGFVSLYLPVRGLDR
jgi:O-antigen/teichoic acid export membrane protein